MFKMNRKKVGILNSEEGFTLVEVIAVLIILGILAAVAVPKFYDMQTTARERAIEGAVAELNGQISLAFAKNVLEGGPAGDYTGFDVSHWSDYEFTTGKEPTNVDLDADAVNNSSIWMTNYPAYKYSLSWMVGDNGTPGRYRLLLP